jgi:hypothetical protein
VIGLIPILLLGTLVLVLSGRLLVQWSQKGRAKPVRIDEYSAARAALHSAFEETAIIKRIFANEDMEFISQTGTADVQRFFLKERKRLAIQWLRMTQTQVTRLMDLHLRLASYTYEPSPRFELKLTVEHLWFILISNLVLFLLWSRGPFEAALVVGYTLRVSERLSSVFSLRLEKIDQVKFDSVRQRPLN